MEWGAMLGGLGAFALLRISRGFRLFILEPRSIGLIIVGGAFAAWICALKCSSRPGPQWLRTLPLLVALFNSALAASLLYAGLVEPSPPSFLTSPTFNALACAGAISALALMPRLVPLAPDSSLVRWIGPLSCLALMVGMAAFFLKAVPAVEIASSARVDRATATINSLITTVESSTGREWISPSPDPNEDQRIVEILGSIDLPSSLPDQETWRLSQAVAELAPNPDQDLESRVGKLIDALFEGFRPGAGPPISSFPTNAFTWNDKKRQWEQEAALSEVSGLSGAYYYHLSRAVETLGHLLTNDGSSVPRSLKAQYRDALQTVETFREHYAGSFSGNWILRKLPAAGNPHGNPPQESGITELLQLPLAEGFQDSMRAADPWGLAHLTLSEARKLLGSADECRETLYKVHVGIGFESYGVFQCHAYRTNPDVSGVTLRAAIRLIYKMENQSIRSYTRLSEVEYALYSSGDVGEAFRQTVMKELFDAMAASGGRPLRAGGGEDSFVQDGFTMEKAGMKVYVPPPESLGRNEALAGVRGVLIRATL
jgi:hypothetical protein